MNQVSMIETSLLITDDSDDHQSFSEALAELTSDNVVLIILDSNKAIKLLTSKKYKPDYLFLDLSMNGMRINSFLKIIKQDNDLNSLPAIVYGEEIDFNKIDDKTGIIFFKKDYQYSELRSFLKKIIKPPVTEV
jgi:CheY-like chemotaxis protein